MHATMLPMMIASMTAPAMAETTDEFAESLAGSGDGDDLAEGDGEEGGEDADAPTNELEREHATVLGKSAEYSASPAFAIATLLPLESCRKASGLLAESSKAVPGTAVKE